MYSLPVCVLRAHIKGNFKGNFKWQLLLYYVIIKPIVFICNYEKYGNLKGTGEDMKTVEDYVKNIPDFPEKGIIFRDITSLVQDKDGLKLAVDEIIKKLDGVDFDLVAGPESRGFIFGIPVAYALNKGFVMVRKKGKLPRETIESEYDLEYGKAVIEIHKDSIKPGQKVVIIDDLMATGGTVEAIIRMIEELGGKVVRIVALIELKDLDGRKKIAGYDFESVVAYEGK